MLTPEEKLEIRQQVHYELADIERRVTHHAGSYNYLCAWGGLTFFAHKPVGTVLRHIPHSELAQA